MFTNRTRAIRTAALEYATKEMGRVAQVAAVRWHGGGEAVVLMTSGDSDPDWAMGLVDDQLGGLQHWVVVEDSYETDEYDAWKHHTEEERL